jgi:thymidylate synthase
MSNYKVNYFDREYHKYLNNIFLDGIDRPDRTGVGSRAQFGKSFTVNLSDGFPITTTRKVAFRIAFEETMFFLRGETDTKKLEEKKINIWKGNTSREFLDKMGLNDLPEGDMGKGYGYQWARWDSYEFANIKNFRIAGEDFSDMPENGVGLFTVPSVEVYDATVIVRHINQAKEMLERAKKNPNDRRLLISAWNVAQLTETPLVPCHLIHQYQILDGKLNSLWFQRSVDSVYGLPYNVMSYAFLNIAFSKYLGLTPGTLTFMGGDCHIYSNQLWMVEEQLKRFPFDLPTLNINKELNTFKDILELEYSDIELVDYEAHPDFKDKPPMAV